MRRNNTNYVSSGTSLCTLLTVAFVVLKLCNIINWSWWWVLSPTLIPIGIILLLVIIIVIIYYAKTGL